MRWKHLPTSDNVVEDHPARPKTTTTLRDQEIDPDSRLSKDAGIDDIEERSDTPGGGSKP